MNKKIKHSVTDLTFRIACRTDELIGVRQSFTDWFSGNEEFALVMLPGKQESKPRECDEDELECLFPETLDEEDNEDDD